MSVRRVLRGGFYYVDTWDLRTTNRIRDVPVVRYRNIGFRIVIRRKQ
jgi:hypothetical protein